MTFPTDVPEFSPQSRTVVVRRRVANDPTKYVIDMGDGISGPEIGFYPGPLALTPGQRVRAKWNKDMWQWQLTGPGLAQGNRLKLTLLDDSVSLSSADRSPPSWSNSDFLAALNFSPPHQHFWEWDGTQIVSDDPQTGASTETGMTFSHDGSVLVKHNQGLDLTQVFNFTDGTLGTLIATTDSQNNLYTFGLVWSQDDAYIAQLVPDGLSPTISQLRIWPFDGSSFGAQINPGINPAAVPDDVAAKMAIQFSPDGTAIAVADGGGTFLLVYPFDGNTLGVPVSPSVAPSSGGGGNTVAWSPDSDFVALGFDESPFVAIYPWDGSSLGAEITPSIINPPGGEALCVLFDNTGTVLFVAGRFMDESQFFYAYQWDGTTFGERADPAVVPSAFKFAGMGLSKDNSAVAIMGNSSQLLVYSTALTNVLGTPLEGLSISDLLNVSIT